MFYLILCPSGRRLSRTRAPLKRPKQRDFTIFSPGAQVGRRILRGILRGGTSVCAGAAPDGGLAALRNASGGTMQRVWWHYATRLVALRNVSGGTTQRVWWHYAACLVALRCVSGGTTLPSTPGSRGRLHPGPATGYTRVRRPSAPGSGGRLHPGPAGRGMRSPPVLAAMRQRGRYGIICGAGEYDKAIRCGGKRQKNGARGHVQERPARRLARLVRLSFVCGRFKPCLESPQRRFCA